MNIKETKHIKPLDPTSVERKKDHIELAFQSQNTIAEIDHRFYYEPILSGHPRKDFKAEIPLLGNVFDFPIWVSSMTGGTAYAKTINTNLARICKKYNLGMGLGSCRSLLYDDEMLDDFNVRHLIGDRPLYANLGIAQVEELVEAHQTNKITILLDKLSADGLIVHINPLQEWLQPEGDRYFQSPILTLKKLLDQSEYPIIVKEVGQGMGKESLRALLQLPIQAIDFAANGGTNFSKLELLRGEKIVADSMAPIVTVGHSAAEMVNLVNELTYEMGNEVKCREVIVSGGIKNFLDGYYCIEKLGLPAIYGQASTLLKYAKESYNQIDAYLAQQIEGLKLAYSFLKIKE